MYKPCSEMMDFSGTETFVGSNTKFILLAVMLEIKNTYQKTHWLWDFSVLSSIPVVQEKSSQLFLIPKWW